MNDKDKSEFVRARVSKRVKVDFDEICETLGKTPTEQLRELVEGFVDREYGVLRDRIAVHIYHPEDYDPGAWRVTIKLRNPNEMIWSGAPWPFGLPDELPMRRLRSDPEYSAVLFDRGQAPKLGGKFVGGEWRGHLYSNGCHERDNPTSVDAVRDALQKTIQAIIERPTAN